MFVKVHLIQDPQANFPSNPPQTVDGVQFVPGMMLYRINWNPNGKPGGATHLKSGKDWVWKFSYVGPPGGKDYDLREWYSTPQAAIEAARELHIEKLRKQEEIVRRLTALRGAYCSRDITR